MNARPILYRFRRPGAPLPANLELFFTLQAFVTCRKIIGRSATAGAWLRAAGGNPDGRAIVTRVDRLAADIDQLLHQRDLLLDGFWHKMNRSDMQRGPRPPRASAAAPALRRVRADLRELFELLDAAAEQAIGDCEARDQASAALLAGTARPDIDAGHVIRADAAPSPHQPESHA